MHTNEQLDAMATECYKCPIHKEKCCQFLRRAIPAARPPPLAPFRDMGGSSAPALLSATVRRALFDRRRSRSDDAALDGGWAGSDKDIDRRGGAERPSTGASRANLRLR